MSSKMWGGRFDLPADKFAEEFGAVIHIETRMCQDDIQGSIAHAKMLAHQGIISQEDGEKIVQGLGVVLEEIKSGQSGFPSLEREVHTVTFTQRPVNEDPGSLLTHEAMDFDSPVLGFIFVEAVGTAHVACSRCGFD